MKLQLGTELNLLATSTWYLCKKQNERVPTMKGGGGMYDDKTKRVFNNCNTQVNFLAGNIIGFSGFWVANESKNFQLESIFLTQAFYSLSHSFYLCGLHLTLHFLSVFFT